MADFVTFSFRDEDTLVATGRQGAFSGIGIGLEYVAILQNALRHFASELHRFPRIAADLDLHGPGVIKISVKQVDALGHIVFRARLAERVGESSADLHLNVDYEAVARFAKDFEKLIEGDADAATITGTI